METTWDKLRAVVFALCVHAFALALLFAGLWWQPAAPQASAEGPMIEATLVSSPQQSVAAEKAIRKAEQQDKRDATPPPQPKPTPNPQDAPQPQQLAPQAPLPKPDTVNQDEVRRAAELAAEQKKIEQDERRKQVQADLDAKQQKDEENRQRLAQQVADDKAKQLADIRDKRIAQARVVMLADQKLKQLQSQDARYTQVDAPQPMAGPAQPPAGNNGSDLALLAKYKQAIIDTTNSNWIHTDVPQQVHCKIQFTQIPGGEVIDVKFIDCRFDATARESVDRAMHKTPLPYAGFETEFPKLRQWELDFCYPTEACTK